MNKNPWHDMRMSPRSTVVETKVDDGKNIIHEALLIKYMGLWFPKGKKIQIDYTPTHWRYL